MKTGRKAKHRLYINKPCSERNKEYGRAETSEHTKNFCQYSENKQNFNVDPIDGHIIETKELPKVGQLLLITTIYEILTYERPIIERFTFEAMCNSLFKSKVELCLK